MHYKHLHQIFAVAAAALVPALAGCVTQRTSWSFGTHSRSLDVISKTADTLDGTLIEFKGQDSQKGTTVYHWARVKHEALFSGRGHDYREIGFSLGAIPKKELSSAAPGDCVTFENAPDIWPRIVDKCTGKSTWIIGGSYSYRDWWHTALLPIVYPFTVAADIVLSPLYISTAIWCRSHNCTPS